MKQYQIIYADPPWSYKENWGNGSHKHSYPGMAIEDIKALKVLEIADNECHLYLWVTNPFIQEGLDVMKAWGFEYKTMITWLKTYENGEPEMGMGYYFRGCTEHLLFGVKGKKKILNKTIRNFVKEINPKEHSKKPPIFRKMITECSGDVPRIELFARKEDTLFENDDWKGWDVWGNEVENDINLTNK